MTAPPVPDAVVFDFDGLILDTESSAFESTRQAFADHGVELTMAMWHHRVGSSSARHWTDDLEELLGRPVDRPAVRARRDRQKLDLLALEVVRPGVVELLAAATAAGVPLAVASSSPEGWVRGHLERLGLIGHFAAVVTRSDVDGDHRRTKPAPDLYALAVDRIGAEPARSVAIEDSPNGLAAARAAGLRCVAVPCPVTAALDLSAADLVVASLADVDLVALGRLVSSPAP